MADFTLDFDTPKSSSNYSVQVLGTILDDNTQRYVRINVNVTNAGGRDDFYYRTVPIAPTETEYAFHGTYNLAIVPKADAGDSITATYAFSFTAQA